MAEKKNQPKNGLIIIVVLLVAGAGLLYWQFFLRPAISEISSLRNEKSQLVREAELLKTKLEHKPDIEQKWNLMREKEPYLLTRVPESADLPQVLGAIEQLVRSASLEVEALNAAEFQADEHCCFIPISLKAKGAAEQLLLLLEELEQFSHLTLTEQASIEKTEDLYRLSVDFNLIFIPEKGLVEMAGSEEGEGQGEAEGDA